MDLLGEAGQESAIKTNVLRMFYFKKRFNSILIIALGKVEAGVERNEQTVTFNK